MLAIVTFLFAALNNMVAQAPPQGPPPAQSMQPPLESGACLDSPRPVPKVLQKPVSRGMQIVRIDEVVSTATMTQGQVIGFVYTTQDGGTWLGERTANFVSPANATAINAVLASTRVPGVKDSEFPPRVPIRRADQVPPVLARLDSARCHEAAGDHARFVRRLAGRAVPCPTPASKPLQLR